MIKKLTTYPRPLPNNPMVVENIGMDNESLFNKINELCDVVNTIQKEREAERFEIQEWIGILEAVRKSVNIHERQIDELQMKLEPHKCETRQENAQDQFAEQRKWIGKLCKFKCGQGCYYGILTNIKRKPHEIPFESNGRAFSYCEPVKPTDSIIYKGGDNE